MRYLLLILLGCVTVLTPASNGFKLSEQISKKKVMQAYCKQPLAFIENEGQMNKSSVLTEDKSVCYYVRQPMQTIYLTKDGVVFNLFKKVDEELTDSLLFSIKPVGMNKDAQIEGFEEQQGKINYLSSNDPSKCWTNISTYKGVIYNDIYDGIALKVYGNGRNLETEYLVKPQADPSKIIIRYEGIKGLRLDEGGNLLIDTAFGELKESRPYVYQEKDGRKIEVKASYRVLTDNTCTVALASYDKRSPLVIDPTLSYSTYLGGSGIDVGFGTAVDSSGAFYVTGYTKSRDFPYTTVRPTDVQLESRIATDEVQPDYTYSPANPILANTITFSDASTYDWSKIRYISSSSPVWEIVMSGTSSGSTYSGSTVSHTFYYPRTYTVTLRIVYKDINDLWKEVRITKSFTFYGVSGTHAFVTKFNATGSLVYSTILDPACGFDIAVDSSGFAYVTGAMSAGTATGAFSGPAFVAKLNETGSSLVYFINLDYAYAGYGIAVDSQGAAYVAGRTDNDNAFVTKINPAGSIVYSRYFGGSGSEGGLSIPLIDIAIDSMGAAYVTGVTWSSDFPLVSPIDSTFSGVCEAFVLKVNPEGSAMVYSTYLGGSGAEVGYAIAVDSSDAAYVTGFTTSNDFPVTPSAFDRTYNGGKYEEDAFVAKINPEGTALVYSTYLGGSGDEIGYGIAVDSFGGCYIAGATSSGDFPLASAFDSTLDGTCVSKFKSPDGNYPLGEAFITKLNPEGSDIIYSTFLGGTKYYKLSNLFSNVGWVPSDDIAFGLAIDSAGTAYVTGVTWAIDFPAVSAFDSSFGGIDAKYVSYRDAFVAKIKHPLIYPDFIYSPLQPVVKETITFTDATTYSRESIQRIQYYRWDFGDGRGAKGAGVKHAYAEPGSYTVTLYVGCIDSSGDSWEVSVSKTVTVYPEETTGNTPRQTKQGSDVDLVRRAAWPEQKWPHSGGEGVMQELFARVRNFSNTTSYKVMVRFIVTSQPQNKDGDFELYSAMIDLKPGATEVVSVAKDFNPGMYLVIAQALYSVDGVNWKAGDRVKRFGFPVLQ